MKADRKDYIRTTGGHMDTQALQHQDELEKQQMILEALKRLWWMDVDGEDGGDADALLIASALGLSKEFNKMLEPKKWP